MADLTKLAGTVLASAAIAAIPASVAAAPTLETEPNNTFSGQPATVGVTYQGTLCAPGGACSPSDSIDFFHYTGLPPGGSFDLSFDPVNVIFPGADAELKAGLYTGQTTIGASVTSTDPLVHLTGTIPGSGELVFGITIAGPSFDVEGYTTVLNVRSTGVPAPATIVLLAAGLTAMGLDVARRRKRSY